MTKQEITDIVYDTLMQNKQPPYEAFDLSQVDNQECDARHGVISFDYCGEELRIEIKVRRAGLWF